MGLEDSYGVIPSSSIWNKARFGDGVIIANLDTGHFPYLFLSFEILQIIMFKNNGIIIMLCYWCKLSIDFVYS